MEDVHELRPRISVQDAKSAVGKSKTRRVFANVQDVVTFGDTVERPAQKRPRTMRRPDPPRLAKQLPTQSMDAAVPTMVAEQDVVLL